MAMVSAEFPESSAVARDETISKSGEVVKPPLGCLASLRVARRTQDRLARGLVAHETAREASLTKQEPREPTLLRGSEAIGARRL